MDPRLLKVEEDLGSGYYRLHLSEAERRQARHDIRKVEDIVVELLRNSRDAGANHIFLATQKSSEMRSLVCIDDGKGVPEDFRDLIFEPRVTSKLEHVVMDEWGIHGRGMALFSIRQRVREATLNFSDPESVTSFGTAIDTESLPEKADQSTYPLIRWKSGQRCVVRGPHNIPRTAIEFALSHNHLRVYLGSMAEIGATLFSLSQQDIINFSCEDKALELEAFLAILGLQLSQRNIYRILAGEIKPLPPLLEPAGDLLLLEQPDKNKKRERLRLWEREVLSGEISRLIAPILERHKIKPTASPRVRSTHNSIEITIPFSQNNQPAEQNRDQADKIRGNDRR